MWGSIKNGLRSNRAARSVYLGKGNLWTPTDCSEPGMKLVLISEFLDEQPEHGRPSTICLGYFRQLESRWTEYENALPGRKAHILYQLAMPDLRKQRS